MLESSPSELKVMGEDALEYVKKYHSWEKVAADLNDVYEWMLGGSPPKCLYFN
jgi:glycosyltransferase involved in cell wall biosynthesis